jgi:23S rRNA (uracil1939-C5)-methyltransferase
LELTVEKLIYGGEGLARMPADERGRGKAVFVPFVLEGETVDAALGQQKPGFARARVNNILRPSHYRVPPSCPYFGECGGCHYQHSGYEHQLEIKVSILQENLRRLGKVELTTDLKVHPSPPWNYRNRSRLQVRCEPELVIGYHKFGSHSLEPVEQCPISSPLINSAIRALWEVGRAGKLVPNIREVEFFANAEDDQLLIEIYVGLHTARDSSRRSPPDFRSSAKVQSSLRANLQELQRRLPQAAGFAVFASTAENRAHDEQLKIIDLVGQGSLTYQTRHGSYQVSAGSFFQTNRFLPDELIELVTSRRSGHTALDLYAGVGLFSSVLSREFQRVIAVEASQHSASDLAYNSAVNVKTVHATVEHYLKNAGRKFKPDLVIVDPPRGGLGEAVSKGLAAMEAPRITYVSCDPATLARDISPLATAGYRVEQAHLVDLFPQTFHLETVLQLVR